MARTLRVLPVMRINSAVIYLFVFMAEDFTLKGTRLILLLLFDRAVDPVQVASRSSVVVHRCSIEQAKRVTIRQLKLTHQQFSQLLLGQ